MAMILLADDERVFRTQLRRRLEVMGHTVIQARDGLVAWEILQDNPDLIELLITDVMMPELDGIGLVEKVSQSRAHNGLPVLLVSGVVGVKEIRHMLDRGVTRFLGKPIRGRMFEAEVKACLRNAHCPV